MREKSTERERDWIKQFDDPYIPYKFSTLPFPSAENQTLWCYWLHPQHRNSIGCGEKHVNVSSIPVSSFLSFVGNTLDSLTKSCARQLIQLIDHMDYKWMRTQIMGISSLLRQRTMMEWMRKRGRELVKSLKLNIYIYFTIIPSPLLSLSLALFCSSPSQCLIIFVLMLPLSWY